MSLFGRKVAPIKEIYCAAGSKTRKGGDEEPTVSRITFDKLEIAAVNEPILFGGWTMYQNCIKECGFIALDKDGDVNVNKEIKRILTKTQFKKTFLEYAPRHLGIWGNAFIENIYNKKKNSIVNFCAHNPKTFDFARENMGKVLFDGIGEPVGYVQDIFGQPIEFTSNEINHLPLNQINRGEMGYGFVEPVYHDIELKENIEHGKAELAFRRGYPLPFVEYGDEQNQPNPKLKQVAEDLLDSMVNEKTTGIYYPYYFKADYKQPPEANVEADLKYSTILQAAVLGCPVALLTQTGEGEGRSTLESLIDFFEIRFKSMQSALQIEEVLEKVLQINGYEAEIEVQYGVLSQKSMKEQVMRIQRLAKVGLIDIEDKAVQDYVRKLLGIVQLPHKKEEKIL